MIDLDALAARIRPLLPTWAAAVLVVALVAVGLQWAGTDEPGPGEARLEVTEGGLALVERARGGTTDEVRGSARLGPGDRVTMADGGAILIFGGGVRLELRAGEGVPGVPGGDTGGRDPDGDVSGGDVSGGDGRASSVLAVDDVPRLEAGEALVAAGARPAEVEVSGTQVTVLDGTTRVSRSVGVRVASYTGSAEIDSAGQRREVPALRQLLVSALGRAPTTPRALTYDRGDEWDRRLLGGAIDLGERLESLAAGYSESLPAGVEPDAELFRAVLAGVAAEPELDVLVAGGRARPAGDVLVGAAIADLGERGDFAERWAEVFAFRDLGAKWGLVALDQGIIDGSALEAAVEAAIGMSPSTLAPGELAASPGDAPGDDEQPAGAVEPAPGPTTVPPQTTPGGPPPPPPGTSPPPPPPDPTTTTPPPTTTTTTAPPPTTLPPPPNDGGILGPIIDPLTEGIGGGSDGLLGGLLGP